MDFLMEEMNFKLLGWGIVEKNKIKKLLWYIFLLVWKFLVSKDLWYIVGLLEYMYKIKLEYGFFYNFVLNLECVLYFWFVFLLEK